MSAGRAAGQGPGTSDAGAEVEKELAGGKERTSNIRRKENVVRIAEERVDGADWTERTRGLCPAMIISFFVQETG